MLRLKSFKLLFPLLLGVALAALAMFVFVAPTALASAIVVSPSSGPVGTSFWVMATGFHQSESVATWVGRPDGTTIGTGTIAADAEGVAEFSVTPPAGWPLGEYRVVARGKSGLELHTSFTLYAAAPAPSATTTPAATSVPMQAVNVYSGRTFYYTGAHYKPGELVWVWYINPNQQTISFGKMYANEFGNVYFPVTLGKDWSYGAYNWAARGQSSGHVTSVIFSYFDRQISSMVASDPVTGQPIWYEFTASGFQAYEHVNMWIDGPNGLHKDLPHTSADENGDVVWTTYVEPGLPCGNYRVVAAGLLSHHVAYEDNYYCY